ncbi:MAG: glycerol-3-phosphate 1-O-acyltransferase PlsY [Chloroflexota bacterium]
MIGLLFVAVVLLGYLIGAIPCGVLAGRLTRRIDVRDYGSGGMGMTNVQRTLGAKAAGFVFVADLLKGAAAVGASWGIFAAFRPDLLTWSLMAGGAAAVIGHNWPVYVGFRGGRGVSTSFGALLVISWPVALIAVGIFILVVALSRYVSLGSILAGLAMVLTMIVFVLFNLEPFAYLVFGLVVVTTVVIRHRGNIKRLLSGTERKLGQRTEVP